MNPHLVILVGIPGCGKSTWADNLLVSHYVVSSDAIRAEFGDVTDQTRNQSVFDEFHKRIADHLFNGRDVVADSTALDMRARVQLCDIARKYKAPVDLVYFTNCAEAANRNRRRERVVPEDVMQRMLDKYERFRLMLSQEAHRYHSITEIGSTR